MAIVTASDAIDGLLPPEVFYKNSSTTILGFQNSLFYSLGWPRAAAVPTPGLSGEALTSYGGQLNFPSSGSGDTYLASLQCNSSKPTCLILMDRLWHNSGIVGSTTTEQTIDSVAWPARDKNGSSDGVGVMVALEASTAATGSSGIVISYTNSGGTSGKTGSYVSTYDLQNNINAFQPFTLDAGDVGVRSIQSITLTNSIGGGAVVHLVAYRVIAVLPVELSVGGTPLDFISCGAVRIPDGAVPFMSVLAVSALTVTVVGRVQFTKG